MMAKTNDLVNNGWVKLERYGSVCEWSRHCVDSSAQQAVVQKASMLEG